MLNYEICALLGYYAALSGSSVPTFRDNLSVPYSRIKKVSYLKYLIGRVNSNNIQLELILL
jgi:hypothetical protein